MFRNFLNFKRNSEQDSILISYPQMFLLFQLNPIIAQTTSASSMRPDSQTNIIGSSASSPYNDVSVQWGVRIISLQQKLYVDKLCFC